MGSILLLIPEVSNSFSQFSGSGLLLQNELLTCLWYLNLGYTLRSLGVIQKFNNDDNDNEDQYRCQ